MPSFFNVNSITHNYGLYWGNALSTALNNGEIESFVIKHIKDKPVSWAIVTSDGVASDVEFNKTSWWCVVSKSQTEEKYIKKFLPGTKHILGMLCCRFMDPSPYLLLPLDDKTFKVGLSNALSDLPKPSWENRKPIAIWRGSVRTNPSIRTDTVKKLLKCQYANVKLTREGINDIKIIPASCFGDHISIAEQFKYKYNFIIDGAMIASNHQWVFGSGSVPIMITHPENSFWFKKYLIPMKNYVPIKYDLSDLEEKLEWLVNNDHEARRIADGALHLTASVFSHEGQAKYLEEEIYRLSCV